jgi:hypothetical protein
LIIPLCSHAWPASPASHAVEQSLARLWAGQAKFEPYLQLQIRTKGPVIQAGDGPPYGDGMNGGTEIVPLNGVWYMFNREYHYEPQPPQCRRDHARIVVRKSLDRGRSWSPEAVVASPDLASGECALTDGWAYWDAESGTWHYLAQELAAAGGWNLNHYTRHNPDPLGPFTPDPNNPVVHSGELWRQICGPGKMCPTGTHDEGTSDIVEKRNGYFVVSFHGAFGRLPLGFRGVAETSDFHRWVVGKPDLPGDAIWSSRDCQGWAVAWNAATGCVGGGAASTMVTPHYVYMLIESTDLSLGCTRGQHWEFGLVRAPWFVKSGNWQQMPKNPLLIDTRMTGCALQYAQLFNDGADVYLSYWTTENTPEGMDRNNVFHIERLR